MINGVGPKLEMLLNDMGIASHAEHLVVSADADIVKMPDGVDFPVAAAAIERPGERRKTSAWRRPTRPKPIIAIRMLWDKSIPSIHRSLGLSKDK